MKIGDIYSYRISPCVVQITNIKNEYINYIYLDWEPYLRMPALEQEQRANGWAFAFCDLLSCYPNQLIICDDCKMFCKQLCKRGGK